MTKSEYAKLLLDDRWDVVRLRILGRDRYMCTKCGHGNVRLSVHHKVYYQGEMPWDVPDKHLISLCDTCHAKEHENRLISTYIKKRPISRTSTTKSKPKNKSTKGRVQTHEEKLLVAKVCVLQRCKPNDKRWNGYKKQLFEYAELTSEDKRIINSEFDRVKNSIRKK